MKTPDRGGTWNGFTGYRFLDRHTRNRPNVEKISIFTESGKVVSYKSGEKIKSYLKRTDGEYREILTFRFLEGAPYTPADGKNRNFLTVINDATRRKFFDNESAVGKTMTSSPRG